MPSTSRPGAGVAAVILAAGASSRMGRSKPLLPWGSTTVLGEVVAQWRKLECCLVSVVCAEADPALQRELERLEVSDRILNPAPEQGMFGSIRCAARWTGWRPGLAHWAVVLADQPLIRHATLEALLSFAATRSDRICQPMRLGHPRHPVLLPGRLLAPLAVSPAQTLKEFLLPLVAQREFLSLDDPGLDLDLDLPGEYEQAHAEFLASRTINPLGGK